MKILTCKRCGFKWDSRVKNPKCCPRCKSYRYETPKQEEKAERREDDNNE